MKDRSRAILRQGRARIDDSPEAIEARMDAFINRTRGWGSRAMESTLPNNIVVLAGPTRQNPRLKTAKQAREKNPASAGLSCGLEGEN
jgi:hypothetical protein